MRERRARERRHLAAQRARHAPADLGRLEAGQREQVRELGQRGLGGEVVAGDDAGGAEGEAGGVQRRDDAARALAHVDDDDAARHGVADDAREAAVDARGRVAHAEGLEHETPQPGDAQHAVDHLGLDAREDAQRGDVRRVQVRRDVEARDRRRPQHEPPVDVDAEARDARERVAVGRREGLERARRHLGAPVAAVQLVVEEEADLGDRERGRDDERAEQVVHGVGLQREDGRLRPREDHRLAEVREHEGERRRRVREGVGAVEHNEPVEEVVIGADRGRDRRPAVAADGGRVKQRRELDGCVADVSRIGAWWRAQTGYRHGLSILNDT